MEFRPLESDRCTKCREFPPYCTCRGFTCPTCESHLATADCIYDNDTCVYCQKDYNNCKECGKLYLIDDTTDGLCLDCLPD